MAASASAATRARRRTARLSADPSAWHAFLRGRTRPASSFCVWTGRQLTGSLSARCSDLSYRYIKYSVKLPPVPFARGRSRAAGVARQGRRFVEARVRVECRGAGGAGCTAGACGESAAPPSNDGPVADWPHWGGSEGGSRYAPLTQITPENVGRLKKAWTYHIGMIDAPEQSSPTFEGTPIVAGGRMFVCSGMGKVAALDPETGKELWEYRLQRGHDRQLPAELPRPHAPCRCRRVRGRVPGPRVRRHARRKADRAGCRHGQGVRGLRQQRRGGSAQNLGDVPGEYSISSPPVIDDGSGDRRRIPDGMRVDAPPGVVRAFDVQTGELAGPSIRCRRAYRR